MGEAASYLKAPNSDWSWFRDIPISVEVKTTYSSKGTGRSFSDGPWKLIRFFTDKDLPENFDLDRFVSASGITIDMVPHIAKLGILGLTHSSLLHHVKYNPLEPAGGAVRVHDILEAKEKARTDIVNIAAEAICDSWGTGPTECYRQAIKKAGLETELERAIGKLKRKKRSGSYGGDAGDDDVGKPGVVEMVVLSFGAFAGLR
ncbi:MAG: hypothetical protein L6R39_000030 [Caloplaca ligustica]|nr:MAG: hypothetical protein L6R39_000030 [Caloplaca ligustica]